MRLVLQRYDIACILDMPLIYRSKQSHSKILSKLFKVQFLAVIIAQFAV